MTKEQFLRKWGWLVLQDEEEILSDLVAVIATEIAKVQEPQPTKQAKPFDKERFERIFCAVVASGSYNDVINLTEKILKTLDAYYATKKN